MEKEKKVIIALYGDQNTGKTTTLRKLAQEVLKSLEEEEDIQVVFSYKKKKIAISTGGDDKGIFEENTDLYKKKGEKKEEEEEEVNWKPDTFATPTRTDKINELYSLHSFSEELQNGDKTTVLRKLSREFLKLIEEKEDIQISFRYKGRKIVISTAGDSESEVQASTDLFGMLNADILVTATRNIGATYPCLSLRNYGKDIKSETIELEAIWISKYGSELLNEAQAKELHAFIDLIIDNWDSEPKK